MSEVFFEITSVLMLAGLTAIIVSLLRQPSILAYIITGLIIGPLGYYQIQQGEVLNGLAQIGITLLLFMAGLGLDLKEIKRVGKIALYTGLGQILFTAGIGFGITRLLGFGVVPSFYIAIALTFSSTIIVVKLLSEKKDLQSLYGKIVVGFLLVQDFAAVLMLILLAGASSGTAGGIFSGLPTWQFLIMTGVKALILILLILWVSQKVFPKILPYFWKSEELLLIFSLAWALGLASLVSHPWVGFSLEIGGFLAGLSLANSIVHYEISARVKSLRDFFIIIFFIVLGSHLVFTDFGSMIVPSVVLSLFVLIGNPIIVLLIMGLLGYKSRTSFFASVTVAQISEFSLVLMALGLRLGHVNSQQVGMVTMVGVATITLSSYMILYSHRLYEWLMPLIRIFDFKKGSAEKGLENLVLKNHVVLVGAHRLGHHIISSLIRGREAFVIVDFNPEVSEKYDKSGYTVVCGDITDPYIQDQVCIEDAKLIISTVPDINDSLSLIDTVRRRSGKARKKPKFIVSALSDAESKLLYENGVDYVISPHFVGGMHLAKILEQDGGFAALKKLRSGHLKMMEHKVL